MTQPAKDIPSRGSERSAGGRLEKDRIELGRGVDAKLRVVDHEFGEPAPRLPRLSGVLGVHEQVSDDAGRLVRNLGSDREP